jgi:hypothetical protein
LLTFPDIARERAPGRPDWMFVTWPTIAMSGAVSFDSVLTGPSGARRLPGWLRTTIAHEMAHYYFGTLLRPTGMLRWVVLESTAEYLSLVATGGLGGEAAGTARAMTVLAKAGSTTVPRLDQITHPDQIHQVYRYQYMPSFLLAMDIRYGRARGGMAQGVVGRCRFRDSPRRLSDPPRGSTERRPSGFVTGRGAGCSRASHAGSMSPNIVPSGSDSQANQPPSGSS